MITAEQANNFANESGQELIKRLIILCEGAIIATSKLGGREIDILSLVDKPTQDALIGNHNNSRDGQSIASKVCEHYRALGFGSYIYTKKTLQYPTHMTIFWSNKSA